MGAVLVTGYGWNGCLALAMSGLAFWLAGRVNLVASAAQGVVKKTAAG